MVPGKTLPGRQRATVKSTRGFCVLTRGFPGPDTPVQHDDSLIRMRSRSPLDALALVLGSIDAVPHLSPPARHRGTPKRER